MDISAATLRVETEELCLNIERLEQQLKAKTTVFDEGKQLWDSTYRPRARMLAEAMLSYVHKGDPRIHEVLAEGNSRLIQSDAVNCIETSLSETSASEHLSTVRKQLRDLTHDLQPNQCEG